MTKTDRIITDSTGNEYIKQWIKSVSMGSISFSWAHASAAAIANILFLVRGGGMTFDEIGWKTGDIRTEKIGTTEYDFVLTDPGHFTLENGEPCNFVVVMKTPITMSGLYYVYPSNAAYASANSYVSSDIYSLGGNLGLSGEYVLMRMDPDFASLLKPFYAPVAAEHGSNPKLMNTQEAKRFTLPSQMEVFGVRGTSYAIEANACTQMEYFKTVTNRVNTILRSASSSGNMVTCACTANATSGTTITLDGNSANRNYQFMFCI